MTRGTGLTGFARRFPDRFFDVGISEEHAVVFAAGMATQGLRPVFAVYSTFSQRVVDYIIHDVCLQNLPVVFCLDRAGVVGDDGPTHHGVFDMALFSAVPNLVIMQPKDERELASMLYTAVNGDKPVVIRYPRGCGPGTVVPEHFDEIELGKAEVLRKGSDGYMWALGDMLPLADEVCLELASRGVSLGLVNARFVRPLDRDLLGEQQLNARLFASLENGVRNGGLGSAISGYLHDTEFAGKMLKFGWADHFVTHGSVQQLMEDAGLTVDAIADAIEKALQ